LGGWVRGKVKGEWVVKLGGLGAWYFAGGVGGEGEGLDARRLGVAVVLPARVIVRGLGL